MVDLNPGFSNKSSILEIRLPFLWSCAKAMSNLAEVTDSELFFGFTPLEF